MGDKECLSCGRAWPDWELCITCQDSATRSERLRRERIAAGLEGMCRYCGSVFTKHLCTMRA